MRDEGGVGSAGTWGSRMSETFEKNPNLQNIHQCQYHTMSDMPEFHLSPPAVVVLL
jgi:hypothetical protein